jgi:hypothetical protein
MSGLLMAFGSSLNIAHISINAPPQPMPNIVLAQGAPAFTSSQPAAVPTQNTTLQTVSVYHIFFPSSIYNAIPFYLKPNSYIFGRWNNSNPSNSLSKLRVLLVSPRMPQHLL